MEDTSGEEECTKSRFPARCKGRLSQSEKFSFHIIRTISLRRYLFEREGGKESEREGERVSE